MGRWGCGRDGRGEGGCRHKLRPFILVEPLGKKKPEEKKLSRIANEIIKSVGCYYARSVQGRSPRFEHATPGLVSASDDDKTLAPDSTTSQAKRGTDGLDPFISFYSNLSCTTIAYLEEK